MSTSHALLGILEPEPNYGYELKRIYDQLFGKDRQLAYGQVYATLARLARDGKVTTIATTEPSGGPDRVKYRITKEGIADLEHWLLTPEQPAPHLQATLYLKIVLALLREGDANAFLDAQRSTHIARMRELTKQRREAPISRVLLIDHAIFHLEADLRWIDLTSARLSQLKGELIS